MASHYTCAHCKGEFAKTEAAEKRAHAEARRLWGKDGHAPDMLEVCDECFKAMRAAGFIPDAN